MTLLEKQISACKSEEDKSQMSAPGHPPQLPHPCFLTGLSSDGKLLQDLEDL